MPKARIRQILPAAVLSGLLLSSISVAEDAAKAPAHPANAIAVPPETKTTVDIGYELRYWFIPFGHTTYRGIFDGNTYRASSYFKTSGLVSVFWQAEIDAGASGTVNAHGVSPFIYDSYYRRGGGKKQRVKLTYKSGGPPELYAAPPYNTEKYPVTDKEKEEGVDPMSAVTLILSGVKADAANPCGTVAPVFDGRRRYDVEFKYLNDQPVKLDEGLYTGNAHLCEMHYKQIAGYKPKILKEGQHWPPIYTLVADIPDKRAPLGHYAVPLRVWAKTNWGTVTAKLSTLKIGSEDAAGKS